MSMSRFFTNEQIDTAVRLAQRHGRDGFKVAERYLRRYSECTFGVERVCFDPAESSLSYINLGDTYDYTVCRHAGEFFAGSWGAWYEAQEQEYDTENDTVGCGYCGHHTPIQNDDWRSTKCEQCGHTVSG
jgi:hypothetical protein